MQWTDEGIVLGSKRHGEGNAILELMTRAHGRHLGLVRGGANARLRPVLQAGNTVSCTWRARLDEHLDPRRAAPGMVRFELRLLAELGFGLDLSVCAASGVETDLVYVSPKSGRAVSRQAGEAWKDKLLVLPAFLREACAGDPSPQDIADG